MQTFLPYADFKKSAKVLDNKRLGKQRVEVLQLLKAITLEKYGWQNHPASKMWQGYSAALAEYGIAICSEWKRRGFQDTCEKKIKMICSKKPARYPVWLGRFSFHKSHRSNLLRKHSAHYRIFWPKLTAKLPYVWPA